PATRRSQSTTNDISAPGGMRYDVESVCPATDAPRSKNCTPTVAVASKLRTSTRRQPLLRVSSVTSAAGVPLSATSPQNAGIALMGMKAEAAAVTPEEE